MKEFFFVLLLTFFTISTFGEIISIYKYDETNSTWVLVNQISIATAEASGSFTTTMISGNIGGFIPISLWQSQYGKIEMKVEITQSLTTRISFSPYIGANAVVNGGWITDDLYISLKSNDSLNFDYSVSGNDVSHHLTSNTPVQQISSGRLERIRMTMGDHELYLWLGFKGSIFVGPIVVDTYVVPDI